MFAAIVLVDFPVIILAEYMGAWHEVLYWSNSNVRPALASPANRVINFIRFSILHEGRTAECCGHGCCERLRNRFRTGNNPVELALPEPALLEPAEGIDIIWKQREYFKWPLDTKAFVPVGVTPSGLLKPEELKAIGDQEEVLAYFKLQREAAFYGVVDVEDTSLLRPGGAQFDGLLAADFENADSVPNTSAVREYCADLVPNTSAVGEFGAGALNEPQIKSASPKLIKNPVPNTELIAQEPATTENLGDELHSSTLTTTSPDKIGYASDDDKPHIQKPGSFVLNIIYQN